MAIQKLIRSLACLQRKRMFALWIERRQVPLSAMESVDHAGGVHHVAHPGHLEVVVLLGGAGKERSRHLDRAIDHGQRRPDIPGLGAGPGRQEEYEKQTADSCCAGALPT